MSEFIAITTNYPTVVFSMGLIVVCVFWLLAIIGLVHIDVVHLDFDFDADADASGFGSLSGILMKYGLAGIPVTVIISLLILISWLFCYFASAYLLVLLPGQWLKIIGGTFLIFLCLLFAFPIVTMSLRPMRDVFAGETALSNKDLVGRACEVRSGEVSEQFGQGLIDDGGAGLLLDIRAGTPNNIKRGDTVALVEYNDQSHAYRVIPEQEFMDL